ncbi:MAG: HAMP domain-containing histidine kinase [Nitrospirae bacterium]|nr:HAMP domain-containing histidine kinase [Nitrospirota bacterium]
MGDSGPADMMELRFRFIGRIIAGFTHELKNHLAIIKESGGLQQDLLSMSKKVDSAELHKFLRSVDSQIERGLQLIAFLNRFAHRMDCECSSFSVNEAAEELVALMARHAYQKRIEFTKDFGPGIPPIHNNPSMLQLLIFFIIEEMMDCFEKGGTITVRTSSEKDTIRIAIVPNGNMKELTGKEDYNRVEAVNKICRELLGTVEQKGANGEAVIILTRSAAT